MKGPAKRVIFKAVEPRCCDMLATFATVAATLSRTFNVQRVITW